MFLLTCCCLCFQWQQQRQQQAQLEQVWAELQEEKVMLARRQDREEEEERMKNRKQEMQVRHTMFIQILLTDREATMVPSFMQKYLTVSSSFCME